jgi:hypothetical protein
MACYPGAGLFLQDFFEALGREFPHGLDVDVAGADTAAYSDAGHARGAGGGQSGVGIFDDNALLGADAEALGGKEEALGVGFAAGDVGAVNDGAKPVFDPEESDDETGVAGCGDNGKAHAAVGEVAETLHEFTGASEQVGGGEGADFFEVIGIFSFHEEQLFFGGEAASVLAEELFETFLAADAAEGVIHLAIEGDAQFMGEAVPALVVELGGIDKHAIEVE